MERTSICAACVYYGAQPIALSVDPACRSENDVDRLCMPHRARATEGFCVLCGRREPWISPWPQCDIGACERCTRDLFGADHADEVAKDLERAESARAGAKSGSRSCSAPRRTP